LTADTVNGSGKRARSGAQTLALLSSHRVFLILRSLSAGPQRQAELRREAGFPAQTTLRAHLRELEEIGAIVKRRRSAFPGTLEYELQKPGSELLFVADSLERWLAQAPALPLGLGADSAKAAIKALVEGWSTTMLRALAARPLSLTELDKVIAGLNYPSLERRLGAMRQAGLVEALPANGHGTPYAVTEWARQAVAPLTAAARWECRHAPEGAAPVGRLDAEAGFLLAAPLLRLSAELSGGCRLAVEIPNGAESRLAGALVELEAGRVHSCTSRLQGDPEAWVSGTSAAWMGAIVEADTDRLEMGGDRHLARAVVEGLSRALFALQPKKTPAVSKQS
jgi:DNA-binding HxlR family transcriptional regulator